jgi:hypothetical protein
MLASHDAVGRPTEEETKRLSLRSAWVARR